MAEHDKRYVKFSADIIKGPAWSDDALLKLYVYCMFKASHNTYEWEGLSLQPGDLPLSKRGAAAELSWSKNKFNRKLAQLASCGLIQVRTLTGGTLIHVLNWTEITSTSARDQNEPTGFTTDPGRVHHEPTGGSTMDPGRVHNEPTGGATMDPGRVHHEPTGGATMDPNQKNKKRTQYITTPDEPEGFETLWLAYPEARRTRRAEAAAVYLKAMNDGATVKAMLDALDSALHSPDWNIENGRYIPGLVKWLQKETWRVYMKPKKCEGEERWTSR